MEKPHYTCKNNHFLSVFNWLHFQSEKKNIHKKNINLKDCTSVKGIVINQINMQSVCVVL